MFRGRLSASIPARGASVDRIGLAMTGAFEALADDAEDERRLAHA
jgi:hypothetical protein